MAAHNRYGSQHEAYNTYPPPQFAEPNDGPFNPYDNTQPHRSYEPGGYGYQDTEYRDDVAAPTVPPKKEESSPYNTPRTVPSRYGALWLDTDCVLTRAAGHRGQ